MVNNIVRSWISRCENICYKQITKKNEQLGVGFGREKVFEGIFNLR